MQRELIENIKQINDEISKASSLINKSRNDITLIAVSKKKSHELIEIAFQNGINNFGENYAQELEEKSSLYSPPQQKVFPSIFVNEFVVIECSESKLKCSF